MLALGTAGVRDLAVPGLPLIERYLVLPAAEINQPQLMLDNSEWR